jgi:putative ABC transport system substrate-binding protein
LISGCAPRFGESSASAKVHRIGRLSGGPPGPENEAMMAAFVQGLGEHGYVEGRNVVIEQRFASGIGDYDAPVAELLRVQPAVILAPSAPLAGILREATATIPIVSAGPGDLVASGLAASHARPGGNVTGVSSPGQEGKQLQLLQETVPSLSRVAVLYITRNSQFQNLRDQLEAAASTLRLSLVFVGVGDPGDLEPALVGAVQQGAEGLLVTQGPLINAHQTLIAELAVQARLPSMWNQTDAIPRGGLMAYAPNRPAMYRRAAYFVDRILKGTPPAELPVEEPATFDFILNLRTAHALGLTIPPHMLAQATEVIP